MSDEYISPRVNSARIKDFMDASHPVRVTGKVLNFSDDETHLLMEACDGGKITVMLPLPPQVHDVTDTLLKSLALWSMHLLSNYGLHQYGIETSLWTYIMYPDMTMVNQVIEMTFDPKFRGRLF
ncbi:hypothetical protein BGW80DRAFT_1458870 [Lactifluus volemus]|nr:hypothetical protein BGW80DRAFT_1458870 [Lactifluus volemus]